MPSFEEVVQDLIAAVERLRREADIIYAELVLPSWGSPDRHGFPATLYGYVMGAFSLIDLASRYDVDDHDQTRRMRLFVEAHLGASREAATVAVQLWRHTLMHTGSPRNLRNSVTGHSTSFLLHWRDHLPREQHLALRPADSAEDQILSIGVLYLIEDLAAATASMVQGWRSSSAEMQRIIRAHDRMLQSQKVPTTPSGNRSP